MCGLQRGVGELILTSFRDCEVERWYGLSQALICVVACERQSIIITRNTNCGTGCKSSNFGSGTVNRLLNISVPQIPYLQSGNDDNSDYSIG